MFEVNLYLMIGLKIVTLFYDAMVNASAYSLRQVAQEFKKFLETKPS